MKKKTETENRVSTQPVSRYQWSYTITGYWLGTNCWQSTFKGVIYLFYFSLFVGLVFFLLLLLLFLFFSLKRTRLLARVKSPCFPTYCTGNPGKSGGNLNPWLTSRMSGSIRENTGQGKFFHRWYNIILI